MDAVLDPETVYAVARSAGFTAEAAVFITAIVGAESGYRPEALNDNPRTGDRSYGLAQINMIGELGEQRRELYGLADDTDLYDPHVNLRVAYALSRNGTDWRPWSTYNSAAHIVHIARAQQAATIVGESWASHLPGENVARIGSAALAWSIAQHLAPTEDWERYCLRFVRKALGVDSFYKSAAIAFANTSKRHGVNDTPPPAVPVWWSGGTWGHVALSAGGGFCWSNDILRPGKIDKVRIATISRAWGFTYRGWTEDVNGIVVYKALPKPKPATVVDLSNLVAAFKADPGRPQGRGLHEADVRPVELALMAEGLLDDRWARDGAAGTKTIAAYSRWQKRCGYSGADANGIPGRTSLTKLGAAHGFSTAA